MTMNCNINATTAGGTNAPHDIEIEIHLDPEYSSNINDAGTEDVNRATFIGRNRGKLSLLVMAAVLLLFTNATSDSSGSKGRKLQSKSSFPCPGGSGPVGGSKAGRKLRSCKSSKGPKSSNGPKSSKGDGGLGSSKRR